MSKDTPRDMKIVNLEELQVNRKCTINILAEKDGAVSFKWSVATYTDAPSILSQINEDNLKVSAHSSHHAMVNHPSQKDCNYYERKPATASKTLL